MTETGRWRRLWKAIDEALGTYNHAHTESMGQFLKALRLAIEQYDLDKDRDLKVSKALDDIEAEETEMDAEELHKGLLHSFEAFKKDMEEHGVNAMLAIGGEPEKVPRDDQVTLLAVVYLSLKEEPEEAEG